MARDVPDALENEALEVAGQVYFIPVDQIDVGDRVRPVDPIAAEGLAAAMLASSSGQEDPIEVCRLPGRSGFRLVDGAHRLDAVKINGWPKVKALIVDANAINRGLREVSAQLFAVGLSPIDRAAFVARLNELLRAKAGVGDQASQQTLAIQSRWAARIKAEAADTADTMSAVYNFTAQAAEALGFTDRTIRRDLELHRGLRPDVVAQLRALPVAKNAAQLRTLAKLPEAEQRAVADMIASGDAKSVAEAQAMRNQTPKAADLDNQDKFYRRQIALWDRLSAKSKTLAFAQIFAADPTLPAHLKVLLKPLLEGNADDLGLETIQPAPTGGLVQPEGRKAGRALAGLGMPLEGDKADAAQRGARPSAGDRKRGVRDNASDVRGVKGGAR